MPATKINATSVSPKSQAAVLRALRGVVFTGSGDTVVRLATPVRRPRARPILTPGVRAVIEVVIADDAD